MKDITLFVSAGLSSLALLVGSILLARQDYVPGLIVLGVAVAGGMAALAVYKED